MFMNAVPDGEEYPGIRVNMKNMNIEGDIIHEDYQRRLILTLSAAKYEGAANEYDCAHWNEVSKEEGFEGYCLDRSYNTHHGLEIVLENGSVWKVTKESSLTRLFLGEGCRILGRVFINGKETEPSYGKSYEGNIKVKAK